MFHQSAIHAVRLNNFCLLGVVCSLLCNSGGAFRCPRSSPGRFQSCQMRGLGWPCSVSVCADSVIPENLLLYASVASITASTEF
jgi:hypothetical protein